MIEQKDRDRFMSKVGWGPNGCWIWQAGKTSAGYGTFSLKGKDMMAHRVSLLIAGQVLLDGDVDHLCRVPACVNPAHLQQVSHRENLLRGTGASARNTIKTHCDHGHPLSDGNVKIKDGKRVCLTCVKRLAEENRRRNGKKKRASLDDVGEGKKRCSQCQQVKSISEFYKQGKRMRAMCKICFKARGW